jgi:hypothetical protein
MSESKQTATTLPAKFPGKRSKRSRSGIKQRYPFRVQMGDGRIFTLWARVIQAKRPVEVMLKAEHVRESIRLGGVGNTQTCSMAICSKREAHCFPHRVEGWVVWTYNRAYVVSRLDKNGAPLECYAYAHADIIGKLNDSTGGQQKLLAQLERDGDRKVRLYPIKRYDKPGYKPPPLGKGDGSRVKTPRGAKLRYAMAAAGGVKL